MFSLLTLLTPANIATVMSLLLCEHKVVVHCTVASSAGDVAIALRTLLFPLKWELFFIPLVPVNMLGFLGKTIPLAVHHELPSRGSSPAGALDDAALHGPPSPVWGWGATDAPTPFLVGMPTASIPAILPPDVYTVDLDQGRISLGTALPGAALPSTCGCRVCGCCFVGVAASCAPRIA